MAAWPGNREMTGNFFKFLIKNNFNLLLNVLHKVIYLYIILCISKFPPYFVISVYQEKLHFRKLDKKYFKTLKTHCINCYSLETIFLMTRKKFSMTWKWPGIIFVDENSHLEIKNKINFFTLLFFNSQKQFYIKLQFFYAFLWWTVFYISTIFLIDKWYSPSFCTTILHQEQLFQLVLLNSLLLSCCNVLQSIKDDEVVASGGNLDNSNLPQNKLYYVTHRRQAAPRE